MWSTLKRLLRRRPPPSSDMPRATDVPGRDLLDKLEHVFRGADDVRVRRLRLGDDGVEAALVFIDGLVDENRIERALIWPLLRWAESATAGEVQRVRDEAPLLGERVFTAAEIAPVGELEKASAAVLQGDVVFVFRGENSGLEITNRGWQARPVEAPKLEVTIRGPQDAFTENILWNTATLRRRVRDPNLRIEMLKIGRRSRTDIALVHIEGLTPGGLVEEIRRRLDGIDIDGILDTGYIEHLIEDVWWSPFPHHLKTERPDTAAAALLEGRAVVFADTTPFVLMMPATLDSLFHSPEDSYDRWLPVNVLRWIRFLAALLSVTVPALYVALVAYHPGILPTEFVLHLMASREGVAFPVIIEALIMQLVLELIKEAGFRMPSPIGQTFGIVGGLILGEMGVQAGLVSEAMVIIVAITAVSSFAAVDREVGTVLRLLGLPVMMSAALLGLYGLIMAVLLIASHLVILRSYGVPYVAPYPYYRWSDLKDTVVKGPLRTFKRRPSYLHPEDAWRMGPLKTVDDDDAGRDDDAGPEEETS